MRPCRISHILLGAAVLAVFSGAGTHIGSGVMLAQSGGKGQPKGPPYMQPGLPTMDQPGTVADPVRVKMDEERMKAMNDDRRKKLSADVDRLIELTNELKTDVDKTTKDELSLEVIKKAQEIEKLAHDVQSRMKN
ncbi:MAG TPA: hypothetical protein VMD92_12365 [Acidobacteriaceae bacterium]|nr:hypothetical protein [Acidobacteriaceae bacterium]